MVKQFFKQVLPAMAAFAFSGLYTIVDGFFIGRSVGDVGLAAVNIAYPLSALLQAAGTGIGMGAAVCISVCRGRGDTRGERGHLGGAFLLLAAAGVLLAVSLFSFGTPALAALGARGEVLEQAIVYLRVILLGIPFQLAATALAPLIRNYDGALAAMGAMIAGFVTNIVLDALFVSVFGWGMAGAAGATVIGQIVTAVPCAFYLWRVTFRIGSGPVRPAGHMCGSILRTAVSPFGLAMSPLFVIMLLNKAASVYGGESSVAAYAVISYATAVVMLLLQGVGDGSQPQMSLYFGMDRPERTKAVRNLAYGFAAVTAVANIAALCLLRVAIPVFFGASGEAAAMAAKAMPVFTVGFIPIAFCRVTTAYFYETQHNRPAYVMVYGEAVLLALLLAFVFPRMIGMDGVWISLPVAQILLMLIGCGLLWRSRRNRVKDSRQVSNETVCDTPAL